MLKKDSIITGIVTSLAFGGEGIIRHDGFVIFVPFVAPGDQVEVRITKCYKKHAFAELTQLLSPSHQRIAPRCPYFGTCGGCQLQHIAYEHQLEIKRQNVQDALQRVGKRPLLTPLKILGTTAQWNYRRHIRLQLHEKNNGYEAGYVREDLQGILPISKCPIFVEEDNPLLKNIQFLASQLQSHPNNSGSVSIIKASPQTYVLVFQFEKSIPSNAEAIFSQTMQKHPQWQGIICQSGLVKKTFGKTSCQLEADGLHIAFSPLGFVQNHPEQSMNLYQDICSWIVEINVKRVLDLYCGIGITSLMLAKRGISVMGVEGNASAITMAEHNAVQNHISATFVKADVAKVIASLDKKHAPELILVNPPRTGLDPTTKEQILKSKAPYVLYISCMPTTLARDLQALTTSSEQIIKYQSYDMFPQTSHVETAVLIKKIY